MMTNDIDIKLLGEKELRKVLHNLDYKTQQAELKKILRDTASRVVVKKLRSAAPGSTSLKKSFGTVTGKSKSVATVFVGPRVPRRGGKQTSTNKGYLATIIEFNKFKPRYPGVDRFTGKQKPRPKTPMGVRMHSGVFPWRPFIRKAFEAVIPDVYKYEIESMRKIIDKEWGKHLKLRA